MPNELAEKILNCADFYEEKYSLSDLFKIRDALMILKGYNLEDLNLLEEVEKFIKQKEKFGETG